jgi:hypothetical protein
MKAKKDNINEFSEENGIRISVIFIATVIVIAENYAVSSTWNGFSLNSLFINAVFVAFILSLLNLILARINQKAVLRPSEMLLIYTMIAIATGSAGHDTLEMLAQTIGHPFWFATPENEWQDLFFKYLPDWLTVQNRSILEGFYTYEESFYESRVFWTWFKPLLFWSAFLIVLYFCMICINLILRKQWTEYEKLSFPVAQIPLGLINPKLSLFKNKLFWYGFCGTLLLSLFNGLHRLYPVIPGITYGKFDLTPYFTEKPWNAMDVTYIEFLPFIIGLAFFIPVNLSFSTWFFYWFWKMEMVLGSAVGYNYLPWFPGYWSQGMGAILVLFVMFIFWSKNHLWRVLKTLLRSNTGSYENEFGQYSFAIIGLIIGFMLLIMFCFYAGMAIWVAIMFMGGFFIISIIVTRVRAELGPPSHDFPFTPTSFMMGMIGPKRFDASTLTQLALFKFIDYGHRSSPMPHILESFYMKDKLQIKQIGTLITAMIIAIVIGTLTGMAGNLQRCYATEGQTWVGDWAFAELANWLRYPSGISYLYIIYFSAGGIITSFLVVMSRFFVWWPFHPLGYILGGEWMLRYLWFSIFIAWLLKWMILKFGGLKGYTKSVPIFLGITMGDAMMLALWKLYGNLFNKWTLDFVYW